MVKKFKKQANKKYKFIKDKSLKKFILQHFKKEKLDYTKFKISSFLECLNSEEEEEIFTGRESNLNKESKIFKIQKDIALPTFGLSLLKNFSRVACTLNEFQYKSNIFQ